MSAIKMEAGKVGLVGIDGDWVLPPRYNSLRVEKVGCDRSHRTASSSVGHSLARIIAGDRHGLVYDQDPTGAVGFSTLVLEPIYERLQIRKLTTEDATYLVTVNGMSGRIQYGKWIDPLKTADERNRLYAERKKFEEDRERHWSEQAQERQQVIQARRKAVGRCIMCGRRLGLLRRLLRNSHHPACVKFTSSGWPAEERPNPQPART
jgi:hypothetical protein